MLNALTIDVEDYFMVSGFEQVINRGSWATHPVRFQIGMQKILTILKRRNTRATFFYLGWIADHFPESVSEVAAAGHEIAIHGYEHRMLYELTPETFEADIIRTMAAIRKIYDGPLLGFRAPSFSIREETMWALPILEKLGLRYDSSIFPFRRGRYGVANAPVAPYQASEKLIEFPLSTVEILGKRIPVCGGGYFRMYPEWITRWAIAHLNRQKRPAVIYLHPWELDPEQPFIQADRGNTFRHRVNLDKTEERLDRICTQFSFGTMQEVLGI